MRGVEGKNKEGVIEGLVNCVKCKMEPWGYSHRVSHMLWSVLKTKHSQCRPENGSEGTRMEARTQVGKQFHLFRRVASERISSEQVGKVFRR